MVRVVEVGLPMSCRRSLRWRSSLLVLAWFESYFSPVCGVLGCRDVFIGRVGVLVVISFVTALGDKGGQRDGRYKEMSKKKHDKGRGSCFVTHVVGLSFTGSPLVSFHDRILRRASITRPHPFEKGRGASAASSLLR